MSGYRFRIVTYRAGLEVGLVTRNLLSDAKVAFVDLVERARRMVEYQKVPRRAELLDDGCWLRRLISRWTRPASLLRAPT
jgi:hypothetical protein